MLFRSPPLAAKVRQPAEITLNSWPLTIEKYCWYFTSFAQGAKEMKTNIHALSECRTNLNGLLKKVLISLVLSAGILSLLPGCDMESPVDPATQGGSTPISIKSAELASFIKVEVKAGDPEKYIVHFSWPVIEDGKIIRVRLDKVLAEVLPAQTFFTHQVSHDQRLKYYVDILDQSKSVQTTFSREVIIPTDYVVRENQNTFSGPTELYINRLYLDSSMALQTLGYDVSIFTNEIHSLNGVIRTFPEGTKTVATEGVKMSETFFRAPSGRGGGKLIIKTSKLIGEMRIELRGENGADGKNGVANTNRAADGSPGSIGEQRCWEHNGYQDCTCHRDGSNGGNGTDGSKGENGWYGGNGGATGTAQIFIQSYTPATSTDPTYPNEKRLPVTFLKVTGNLFSLG